MTSYRRRIIIVALLVLWLGTPFRAQAPATPPDLDAYVERVLRAFDVPGLALAIVRNGQVVVSKGYGVRKLGEPPAVDAQTLFGIASNTKLFTATALGLLVEERKIAWDAPVVQYLPGFQMWDPFVTRELTIRDLLVHRSGLGLGAGDLLWWPASTYDRKEIARRLRFIRPATSFRSAYAYDNVLYLVAGEVIEAVSGQSWEDFVATRILAKVGMRGSNVRHSAAAAGGNIASPHAPIDRVVRAIKPFDSDNTNPAGGINSSADDMAKWMMVQLGRGRLADGSRLFSENTWRQLTTLVTPMPLGNLPPELAALRAELPRLRAGARRQRLSRAQDADAHRRAARLRVEGDDDSGAGARDRRPDEPGIRACVRVHRLPRRGSLSRRSRHRLAGGVSGGCRAPGAGAGRRRAQNRDRNAMRLRVLRSRSSATPARTPTPGTATSSSSRRPASS